MKNKDILKYANFGDKFVCRNGDIALSLWMNKKEGYSLQLENEKNPQHYDVDGHWYSQNYKETLMISFQRLMIKEFLRMY